MEEAETLCDRLCIMVDGSLQCIGTPKEVFPYHDIIYTS
jgi:ABC-type multidrug transport system ATPase subunit